VRSRFGVKDVHCFGFGSPPCVCSMLGAALDDLVTNVVLRDDLVCRLSPYTVRALVSELESENVTERCRKYLSSDWNNLKRDWASFFHLKSRSYNAIESPAKSGGVHMSINSLSHWFSRTLNRFRSSAPPPSEGNLREGLWIPGKIILIDSVNLLGQSRASVVSRQDPSLCKIRLHTDMITDHKGESYFLNLLQILNSSTLFAGSNNGSSCCLCCGNDFLWNSVLNGEPHVWLAKHVCRRCGSFVCDACSRNYRAIPDYGFLYPVRHCDRCYLSPIAKL
jgi:hypothetical protein